MNENKPYTPTDDDMRRAYLYGRRAGEFETTERNISDGHPEFDRWLAAHDAQVARNTLDGLAEWHRAQEADHPYTEAWYAHRRAAKDAENFQDANYPEESPNV